MQPLDADVVAEWQSLEDEIEERIQKAIKDLRQESNQKYNAIMERVDHIMTEVYPAAFSKYSLKWYGFSGSFDNEDDEGDFSESLRYGEDSDSIYIEGEWYESPHYTKDKFERKIFDMVTGYLPIAYLSWTDDEIIQDIKDSIAKLKRDAAVKKEQRKKKKAEKEAAKKKVLKRLSPEERKVLGL